MILESKEDEQLSSRQKAAAIAWTAVPHGRFVKSRSLAHTWQETPLPPAFTSWDYAPLWGAVTACRTVTEWDRPLGVLSHIQAIILESRALLDLGDDWDEDGREGYKRETWERATNFLARLTVRLWRQFGIAIPIPSIDGAGSGSIDLHWKSDRFELLVNIRKDGSAGVYGDDRSGLVVKGPFDPTDDGALFTVFFLQD